MGSPQHTIQSSMNGDDNYEVGVLAEMCMVKIDEMEPQLLNCRHPSPVSVLEPSFQLESCEELFRPNNFDSSKDHTSSIDFALLTLLRLKIGFA
ncbi:hypothetical protein Fmac_015406 [Flemingia macrophylla]|uniref:Uncharacterized protein n=1 Tax=Flemingia macrophylla TaxID=520843 RepID=A0ABD1MEH1_9FABA